MRTVLASLVLIALVVGAAGWTYARAQTAATAGTTPTAGPTTARAKQHDCPSGYLPATQVGLDAHTTVCEVRKPAFDVCASRPGYYACGRNATECCRTGSDNSCFAGAFACPTADSRFAQGRAACCLTH